MQGIDKGKHKLMVEAIRKLEESEIIFDADLSGFNDGFIQTTAAELQGTYDFYLILYQEMQKCISTYNNKYICLQKLMESYINN